MIPSGPFLWSESAYLVPLVLVQFLAPFLAALVDLPFTEFVTAFFASVLSY